MVDNVVEEEGEVVGGANKESNVVRIGNYGDELVRERRGEKERVGRRRKGEGGAVGEGGGGRNVCMKKTEEGVDVEDKQEGRGGEALNDTAFYMD